MNIIELDKNLIHQANYNSFGGKRGDICNESYLQYAQKIIGWPISDSKKEKLLAELHKRFSVILRYDAQHVSVMVAGPSKYNAHKLDKSEQVMKANSEFLEWFESVEKQVEEATKEDTREADLLRKIKFCDEHSALDPTGELAELAMVNNSKFVEMFEEMLPKYKWRKNSNIYKLYIASKEGKVQEKKKEVVFEDENLTAYKYGDRYYIKFVLRVKRQLHVALKSRGWWWNANENAYSTYLDRFDIEWVKSISDRYSNYV